MKKLYIIFFTLLTAFIPLQNTFAQCTCSDGSTPDSLAYEQYFDSIIATNTIISFPQFDPAIGVLKCIKLSDTVTTVVSYNLQNDLAYSEEYNFETYRRSQFTGPGGLFSSVTSPPKTYGPYTLAASDPLSTDDEVDVGPDTVFNKNYYEKYASPDPAYYGTGNVNFNYLTTSTFTILTGSDNAIIKLRAYTRLDVKLTYYWCPFAILATHISDFSASLKDKNVLIQWQVHDPSPNDKYEVEVSSNGKEFKSIGEGNSVLTGSVAKYDLLYNGAQNFSGNLFFRIKYTDASGKNIYSDIRTVSINKKAAANYSLYPNPSVTGINIQFTKSLASNYQVELISSTGQRIFMKKYLINPNGSINIEWPRKPMPGIYYLKVKDLNSNLFETARLQIM